MNGTKHRLLDVFINLMKHTKLYRLFCPFFVGNGVIIVLHRVLPEKPNLRITANSRIEITPQFLEQLITFFLEKKYEVVSLDTVYERLTAKTTGRPFVCFTFDDGYADAYNVIYPIFKKYRCPYCVYVTTDFPDRKSILWWYMLEDLVLENDPIRFSYQGKAYFYKTTNPDDREKAFSVIREFLISVSPEKKAEAIDAVFTPYSLYPHNYEDQQLSWDQVIELSRDPLVTIGAHTVHHHNLKQLKSDQVLWEIRTGKKRLEEKIGSQVRHFAYPFGSRNEAGAREFKLAAECGFDTMTTVREGNIFPGHRKHLECLPRVEVTGRHQDLTLVDIRRCGLVAVLRNGLKRVAAE